MLTEGRCKAGPAAMGYGAVVIAYLLWGFSGVVGQRIMRGYHIAPLDLVAFRMAATSIVLLAGTSWLRPALLRLRSQDWVAASLWGVVGLGLMQWSFYASVFMTNVATGTFLQNLAPLLVTGWAVLMEGRALTRTAIGAICLGLGGVVLLAAGMPGAGDAVSIRGVILGLLSATTHAFYLVYSANLVRRIHPLTLFVWGQAAAAVFWCAFVPFERLQGVLAGGPPALLVYMVLLATVVPFLLCLYGLGRVHSVYAVVIAMIEPVVGSLSAWPLLGESLTLPQVGGAVLVLAAVWMVTRGELRSAEAASASAR